MSGITPVTETMSSIDLGPSGSVQMMFAKLQLAQAELCKNQAEDYMQHIEDTQKEQQQCADMIAEARRLQEACEADSRGATDMTPEMIEYFESRDIPMDTTGGEGDYLNNKEEWDYNIESLMNYQESLGNETQTQMVYLQDFIGQYNSFLQGANSAVSQANQTLTAVATGR